MLFETHAHYDDPRYDEDRDLLLSSFPAHGIAYVVNAGADMQTSRIGVELSKRYDFLYASVGVHPHEAKSMTDKDLNTLEEYAKNPKVVAIGEIGLDYYYEHSEKEQQRYWFGQQLALCKKLDMPVIIHSRDATAETLAFMEKSGLRHGVIHCFSGSVETARQYVEMGFYIGVGGMVTFPKAKTIKEVVADLPLDRLVLETDCPYLAPVPHRGKRNDSRYLTYIAEKVAEIKGLTPEAVVEATLQNGKRLYQIEA